MDAPPRVLIVDDDVEVAQCARRVLEKAGCEVALRDSGFGVVVAVRTFRPDVLLLDLGMPGLNGTAVQRVLTTFADRGLSTVPIVFWSGCAQEELQAVAREAGAYAISKRTGHRELVDRLFEIVQNHAWDPPLSAEG